jgi:hypothetical protein
MTAASHHSKTPQPNQWSGPASCMWKGGGRFSNATKIKISLTLTFVIFRPLVLLDGVFEITFVDLFVFMLQMSLFRDLLFMQQLLILNTLFLWLHPTDLDKQGN